MKNGKLSLVLTIFCWFISLLSLLPHVWLCLSLLESLVIVGLVVLDNQALPNKKLQGLMPHKKLLHLLLVALFLFHTLGEMCLWYLIVGALLDLLVFHLLRVLITWLLITLKDSALELQVLNRLPFLRQTCYVLVCFIDIFGLGLPFRLHCHFHLILFSLHHDELKGRNSLIDQHHMKANQREQHKHQWQSNGKHYPSYHHGW